MKLNNNVIKSLMAQDTDESHRVSIYIPTQPKSTSESMNKDRIQFKNALQTLEGMANEGEKKYLNDTFRKLAKLVDDDDFWRYQTAGLAVFGDSTGYQTVKLPFAPSIFSYIDLKYYISPLLAMDSIGLEYYLLEVNLQNPRLFIGNAYGLKQLEEIDLPKSIDDEFKTEQRKKSLKFRPNNSAGGASFFGHGEVDQHQEVQVKKYNKLLAKKLDALLKERGANEPLLLCGTSRRTDELSQLLEYNNILRDRLTVNPDEVDITELHSASFSLVDKDAKAARLSTIEDFQKANIEQRLDGTVAVEYAASHGKVASLLLPTIRQVSELAQGALSSIVVELPEDMPQFEKAVRTVFEQGGKIQAIEIDTFKDDSSMKALSRY